MTNPERFETNPERFVSCVSHVIRIYNQKTGKTVVIQPSGIVVRSSSAHINANEVGDIPVCEIEYGRVSHLPPFKAGVGLIVSAVCVQRILDQFPDRTDIYTVDGQVRCARTGEILGCKGLIHWR